MSKQEDKELLDLVVKVEEWSKVRNLSSAKPLAQSLKFIEEFGETCKAIARTDTPEIIDGLGDMMVVLVVLTTQLGITVTPIKKEDVVESTYVYESLNALNNAQSDLINKVVEAVFTNNLSDSSIKDALDDTFIKTQKLALTLGHEPSTCLTQAYNEIKDRKGILHNDVYIKMEDIIKDLERYESEGAVIPKEWIEEYK